MMSKHTNRWNLLETKVSAHFKGIFMNELLLKQYKYMYIDHNHVLRVMLLVLIAIHPLRWPIYRNIRL